MPGRRDAGMHPMKRPRRPVARKAKRKPAAKVAKPRKPTFRLTVGTKEDPFHVDPATIPVGTALQWVNEQGNDNVETARDRGWEPVKNVPRTEGMVLVWIAKDAADAQLAELTALARKQFEDANELFQVDRDPRHRSFPIAPSSFMVSSAYETVPADVDPVDVEVSVKLRLSRRFQDAAAALKMPIEQYAQARIALYVRGDLGGLLLPAAPNGSDALELHESGYFNLTPRIS